VLVGCAATLVAVRACVAVGLAMGDCSGVDVGALAEAARVGLGSEESDGARVAVASG
jgi:hypothetical protein